MTIVNLIREFSDRESVPIQVAEVVSFMRELGVKDAIDFYQVDIDAGILKGEIEHWEFTDGVSGNTTRGVNIFTAKSLSASEQRFVECKELLHVLDTDGDRVNTLRAADALIDKIVLPPELIDPATDGDHAYSDRVAILHALAVLFPIAVRDNFMPAFRAKTIDATYIAEMVDLPVEYVLMVMSDYWAIVHGAMVRPSRFYKPDRVATFDADGNSLEVHSVPKTVNAYSFARDLQAKAHLTKNPPSKFHIEKNGVTRHISANDLMSGKSLT